MLPLQLDRHIISRSRFEQRNISPGDYSHTRELNLLIAGPRRLKPLGTLTHRHLLTPYSPLAQLNLGLQKRSPVCMTYINKS